MSKSGANAEPSMEEILASIRQIISDDAPADAPPKKEPALSGGDTVSEADLDALFNSPSSFEEEDEGVGGPSSDPFDLSDQDDAATADGQIDFDSISVDDEDDDEEILDLSSPVADEASPEDDPYDPPMDLDFAEPAPEPVAAPVAPRPAPAARPVHAAPLARAALPPSGLLSGDTDRAVSAAFADLASTMLSANARTLEDLVQDMLRPMLKGWLDDNLPTMVERLVREEIERVARRGPRG